MYFVELVWNREFHFCRRPKPFDDLTQAVAYAEILLASGDGERVKEARVVNCEGIVYWAYGEYVRPVPSSQEIKGG